MFRLQSDEVDCNLVQCSALCLTRQFRGETAELAEMTHDVSMQIERFGSRRSHVQIVSPRLKARVLFSKDPGLFRWFGVLLDVGIEVEIKALQLARSDRN